MNSTSLNLLSEIKRMLFVGDLNPHTRCFQRLSALREMGFQVDCIPSVPEGRIAGLSRRESFWFRLTAKLGIPLDRAKTNQQIRVLANQTKYDIVWVEKGVCILPSTLRDVRRCCAQSLILSYSEDDMFARHNNSIFYRRGLREYDVIFTTKSYNASQEELPRLGAREVYFVDKAFDQRVHRVLSLTQDEMDKYRACVSFVGTFENDRAQRLSSLAKSGYPVTVWGNGWPKWTFGIDGMTVHGRPLYGDEYVKAICASKINMCFLRKVNRDLQTDRSIEIPACGGFMLGERTNEHLRLFNEGTEAEFFDSDLEMKEKVGHYLRNDEERIAIGNAGFRRCRNSGYSHESKLREMLSYALGKRAD